MTQTGSGAVESRARLAAERVLDQAEVVLALARREVQSRFGHIALGYAWTYVAPLVWIAATYFAFYLFGRTSPVYTDIITFIISGLIPYAAFRYVISAINRVPGTTRGLLIFPSVTVEHGVAAMALIEYVNVFVIFAVIAVINYLVFGNGELDNPLVFVEGVTLAWGLGVSYGYLFIALGAINPTFHSIGPILLRPSYFISGVFFTANELPGRVLSLFALNPILHAVEIARSGMLFHYESRIASPIYVLLWIAGMLSAALLIRNFQRQ
jgi:capsular polysaccharide transport system permease protein